MTTRSPSRHFTSVIRSIVFPRVTSRAIAACALIALPSVAFAQTSAATVEAPKINLADTAWMMMATALVLMMTLPGLGLFYAGMVRKKNVLATMAQGIAATVIVSLLWMVVGYSLSFTGSGAFLGGVSRMFLAGITMDSINPLAKTIPESLFMLYQMTFAIITVALVAGAVADRMRFTAFALFSVGWLLVDYLPLAHWVWGNGFLMQMNLLDFAGGTVVHINAGVAGLVAALIIGPRKGYGSDNLAPFDLSLAVIGTGLLWVGWFGFNGGSALTAGSRGVFAIVVTHLSACAGALAWSVMEWWKRGKPSVLGMISGAVAGLGTITPASGFILPWHGVVIGLIAGVTCFWACTSLKLRLGYDDSLDVFGVHGVGGLLGTLLVGVFATAAVSANAEAPGGFSGLLEGNTHQVLVQIIGIAVTVGWAALTTWVLLKLISLFVPLRVNLQNETEGLDITQHGEALQ